MEEQFEDYLKRLKTRRDEDKYSYTDEDFEKYIDYIKKCHKTNLSVYKCLEFMCFETDAGLHNCPECSWLCNCSDQPCSCCKSNSN